MKGLAWFTSVESDEKVGLSVRRIAKIEQQAQDDSLIVMIRLRCGTQIRVVESLDRVQDLIAGATARRAEMPADGPGCEAGHR